MKIRCHYCPREATRFFVSPPGVPHASSLMARGTCDECAGVIPMVVNLDAGGLVEVPREELVDALTVEEVMRS